ncbi:lipopolysaccharide biosynthesis protein [Acinetobacter sp. NIPH 1852]|uniref:lipopolysaccharide biosynthesis protein n=1 Tax=Acinetobacter sp. NIPH 1852 TaxID=2923428 RepID=UPI001F4BC7E5|nr:lipopolysaccharide biosynthesis protein [Acinetobacter sp. NIPH 1852]MCH7306635.1 lipopolysaccharide biosynthesis protein [Acinetobacter sp. NIPH 1852]
MQQFFFNHITKNILKFLYKSFHSKAYKHNRRYWPYYKAIRNDEGDLEQLFFNKRLIADHTKPFKSDKKTCVLVATGPSIKEIDHRFFSNPDYDYIGVNGAISLDYIHFKYYVIIDFNFTTKRFDLVLKVLESDCIFFTTPRCLGIILNKIDPSQIKCQIKIIETILQDDTIEPFMGKKQKIDPTKPYFHLYDKFGFSTNIFNAVFDYLTVPYVALQVCYAIGFKEIYIAGLDMNNFSQPRFYENSENKQPTMLDQYLHLIFPAFDAAATFLSEQNVQVYNLSPQSAIESFKKIQL